MENTRTRAPRTHLFSLRKRLLRSGASAHAREPGRPGRRAALAGRGQGSASGAERRVRLRGSGPDAASRFFPPRLRAGWAWEEAGDRGGERGSGCRGREGANPGASFREECRRQNGGPLLPLQRGPRLSGKHGRRRGSGEGAGRAETSSSPVRLSSRPDSALAYEPARSSPPPIPPGASRLEARPHPFLPHVLLPLRLRPPGVRLRPTWASGFGTPAWPPVGAVLPRVCPAGGGAGLAPRGQTRGLGRVSLDRGLRTPEFCLQDFWGAVRSFLYLPLINSFHCLFSQFFTRKRML